MGDKGSLGWETRLAETGKNAVENVWRQVQVWGSEDHVYDTIK